MQVLNKEIPDSWNMIAVDEYPDIDIPTWLMNARQEAITLGGVIQDKMMNKVHKCTNPTQSNWFISCIPWRELNYVLRMVGNKLSCCLEIGLNTAGTHVIFKHMSRHVISVDNSWSHIMCTTDLLQRFNRHENSDLVWGMSSHALTISRVQSLAPKVDLILIDGDHSKAQVLRDFYAYYHLVKSGGWVLFDDFFSHPEVSFAVLAISQDVGIDMSVAYSEESLQGLAFFQKP